MSQITIAYMTSKSLLLRDIKNSAKLDFPHKGVRDGLEYGFRVGIRLGLDWD